MSFKEMMEQLKREYIDALPGRIDEIRKNYATSDASLVREDFHKLKGTGKTYGFPEISMLAEVVEKICVTKPDSMNRAVPDALDLLEVIHTYRRVSQSFDLEQDQRFHSLKHLAN